MHSSWRNSGKKLFLLWTLFSIRIIKDFPSSCFKISFSHSNTFKNHSQYIVAVLHPYTVMLFLCYIEFTRFLHYRNLLEISSIFVIDWFTDKIHSPMLYSNRFYSGISYYRFVACRFGYLRNRLPIPYLVQPFTRRFNAYSKQVLVWPVLPQWTMI